MFSCCCPVSYFRPADLAQGGLGPPHLVLAAQPLLLLLIPLALLLAHLPPGEGRVLLGGASPGAQYGRRID